MTAVDAIPEFFLLTGFLGSGKTTLLLDLLAEESFQGTGVIVNEVGEINIDGATVASADSGLQLAQLSNGCVCCSMMSDLPMTVAALMDENERLGRPPLRRIVLETSGLSRPAPIIRQLLGLPLPFRITVLATYDCVNGALAGERFEEAAAQLAAAQTIILTKTDRIDEAAREEAVRTLAALNPLTRVLDLDRGRDRVLSAFRSSGASDTRLAEVEARDDGTPAPHERAGVFLARPRGGIEIEMLLEWLDNLAAYCGPRLLRTKGIVRLGESGDAILLQSVGTVFDPPRKIAGSAADAIVIIGRDLDLAELQGITPDLGLEIRDTYKQRAFVCS
ncbi:MAG TPA: GTP-binding protein [Rhizobiaceae bacterium]|nr:GTP-binding protein [Rhizobiaceae bacterium]